MQKTKPSEMKDKDLQSAIKQWSAVLAHRAELLERCESENRHFRTAEDLERGKFLKGDYASIAICWYTQHALIEILSVEQHGTGLTPMVNYRMHDGALDGEISSNYISILSGTPFEDLFLEPLEDLKGWLMELRSRSLLRVKK